MKTPVALFVFKRPDTTEKVFEAIRQAKPTKLFVIADGPRTDRPGEVDKCEATRAIIEQVDWECEVVKNFSDTNLGCAKRVSSGLDWVFSNVEEAIILEDDCLPHPTFFPFCEELLEKYRYDTRIGTIGGVNFQFGRRRTNDSYYFSIYNHCWGWASWKRAWQYYDLNIKLWTKIQKEGFLNDILINREAVGCWNRIFQSVYDNSSGITWDYQWTFACWIQSSLSIIPNVNLISNIGFGTGATNCSLNSTSPYNSMLCQEIEFPLKHPKFVIRDFQADSFTQRTLFKETKLQLLKYNIRKLLKSLKT